MSETYPIKDKEALHSFRDYYKDTRPNPRNYSLIVTGLNTAFRISDLLSLRWRDVCRTDGVLRDHICITEQKTGKTRSVPINAVLRQTLTSYRDFCSETAPQDFLFSSSRYKSSPLSRSQAYRIVRNAAESCGISEHVGCHSLRKTFGYHAWKQGTPPALLMDIYNHSSYRVTKHYLGIDQDERDSVFYDIDFSKSGK